MGEKNLASSAQLPTRIVIRTQFTGCLYVRQLRWVHRKWPAVRKQSVDTMVPHVPRMNGVRWRRRRLRVERCCLPDSEATLGRHVDAALAATQSTPGILGINVKSRPLGQHTRWPHISDHQPTPRTFTIIAFAALLTPLKPGQLLMDDWKFSIHSLGGGWNGTGAVLADAGQNHYLGPINHPHP